MALTVSQLATAIRAGGSAQETGIVTRLLAVAVAQVTRYAGNAPEDVRDEAAIRIAAYLYDMPNAGRNAAYASALRNSGASALLAQYRIHRAGNVAAAAMAAAAIGSDSNPVTGLAIASGALVVTFADGSTVSLTLPAGMAMGNPVTGLSLNGSILTVTFADATTETITLPSPSAVDQTARDAAAAAQATADTATTPAEVDAKIATHAGVSDAHHVKTPPGGGGQTADQVDSAIAAHKNDASAHHTKTPPAMGGGGDPAAWFADGSETLANTENFAAIAGVQVAAGESFIVRINAVNFTANNSNIRCAPVFRVDGGNWQHVTGRLFPSVITSQLIYAAGSATPGAGVVDFGIRFLYTGSGGSFTYEITALRVDLQ